MEKTQVQKQEETIKLKALEDVRDLMGDSFIPKGTIVDARKHPSLSYTFIVKFPYGETIWWCPLYSRNCFQFVK